MLVYGLIGKHLSHSFSKKYFEDKFVNENISNCTYRLFELNSMVEFPELIHEIGNELQGLNVTIPYKKEVIPYLDALDPIAQKIRAVNVVKKENEKLVGYNSDYYGFKKSLEKWLENKSIRALILGTGGASDAVAQVLSDMKIDFNFVSRKSNEGNLSYEELDRNILIEHKLIINATPLGMFPKTDNSPNLPYQHLTTDHYLFDLIYNPLESAFLRKGKTHGTKIKNGLEMLELQAEESWRIWHEKS